MRNKSGSPREIKKVRTYKPQNIRYFKNGVMSNYPRGVHRFEGGSKVPKKDGGGKVVVPAPFLEVGIVIWGARSWGRVGGTVGEGV